MRQESILNHLFVDNSQGLQSTPVQPRRQIHLAYVQIRTFLFLPDETECLRDGLGKLSVLLHEEISRYVFWLGSHTSISYVLAAAKPMSPVHRSTVRYGKPRRFKTSSA